MGAGPVSSASPGGGEPLHFATLWEAIADEIPSAPALTHGARTVAWGEFEQRAARLAGALRAHGLAPGQRRRLLPLQLPRVL